MRSLSFFLAIFLINSMVLADKPDEIKKNTVASQPKLLESVEALIALKQYNQATLLVKQKLSAGLDKDIANYLLARIALSASKMKEWRIYVAQLAASPLFANTQIVAEIFSALPLEEQKWLAKTLTSSALFQTPPPSQCPFYELDSRSLRGQFLIEVLEKTALPSFVNNNLFSELYLHMPETVASERYALDKRFLAWQKSLSAADFVVRMNNLMLFGKNAEARSTSENAISILKKITDDEKCEFRYQNAKLERKNRNYKKAREEFQAIAESCGPDLKLRARYMDLMLASMAGDVSFRPQFDLFVADYPTHGFSDDVLFFAATMERGAGDFESMLATLDNLIKKFPSGDMIEKALFLKGFELAKLGKIQLALPVLTSLREKSVPDSLSYQQAHYWLARLSIFSDVKSLKTPQNKNLPQVKKQLTELVFSRSPTVYSWLSLQLLRELKQKVVQPKKSLVSKSESPSSDPTLVLVKKLIDAGFSKEPLALLEEKIISPSDESGIFTAAKFFVDLKRPEMGYQKLIQCNQKVAAILAKSPSLYQTISLPKPYAAQVANATKHADVPPNLIYAIMRRESSGLTKARSWAGARGLLQMMKATADEQAKKLGIKLSSEEDLHIPELNLLLGSSLIQNHLQRFGNLAVALSAYNAGPGAARTFIRNNDGAPLDAFIESISFEETNRYAKNVLGGFFSYALKDGLNSVPSLDLYVAKK